MCDSIIKRIELLLKEQGKQAKDLCEYANISQNTFSNWKRRGTEPNAKYIPAISDFFHVSERYLLTGEDKDSYYINPEVAELAQDMVDRPELFALLKAGKGVSKESVLAINNFIIQMSKTEKGDD